jgi:MFS family permease
MALGMGCMALAYNIPVYVLAVAVIGFFTPHDMQCVYIFEVAPKEKRATIYSASKCIATLGLLLIPLSRALFLTGDNANWHYVYIIPACVGLVSSILGLCFARETDSFMDHRLEYLHKSDEQRAEDLKKAQDAQGGVGQAFKFCFSHKQLKWLFIVSLCCTCGIIITQNYNIIMSYGYANSYVAAGTYANTADGLKAALSAASTGPVTAALYLFPVGSAIFQFISGPIADKFGRKKDAVVMVSSAIVAFVLFIIGAKYAWNPYLVGFLAGAAVGSYWMSGDIMGSVMISESCPTNLRSSMLSAQNIFQIITMVPVMLISTGLLTAFGNNAASIISLCVAVPGMTVALIILFFKIHETKGLDLNKVRGDEWDEKKVEVTK